MLLPSMGLFLFLLAESLFLLSPDFCLALLLLLGLFLLLGAFLQLVVRHFLRVPQIWTIERRVLWHTAQDLLHDQLLRPVGMLGRSHVLLALTGRNVTVNTIGLLGLWWLFLSSLACLASYCRCCWEFMLDSISDSSFSNSLLMGRLILRLIPVVCCPA